MVRIEGPAVRAGGSREAAMLLCLLHDVVVIGTERLQLTRPEQLGITPMRNDVVRHQGAAPRVGLRPPVHSERPIVDDPAGKACATQWFGRELLCSPAVRSAPSRKLVPTPPSRRCVRPLVTHKRYPTGTVSIVAVESRGFEDEQTISGCTHAVHPGFPRRSIAQVAAPYTASGSRPRRMATPLPPIREAVPAPVQGYSTSPSWSGPAARPGRRHR